MAAGINSVHLKKVVAALELISGLSAVAVSVYFLIMMSQCNPNADLCKPLTLLPVIVLAIPGGIAATAGKLSFSRERFGFWNIQLTMVAAIGAYLLLIALLFAWLQP